MVMSTDARARQMLTQALRSSDRHESEVIADLRREVVEQVAEACGADLTFRLASLIGLAAATEVADHAMSLTAERFGRGGHR